MKRSCPGSPVGVVKEISSGNSCICKTQNCKLVWGLLHNPELLELRVGVGKQGKMTLEWLGVGSDKVRFAFWLL